MMGWLTPVNNFVNDPDHDPTQISWTFSGDQNLKANIENKVFTVVPVDSEWAGSESITLKALDPEGAFGEATVKYTVIQVNDPPQLIDFHNQEAFQFESFQPINLDDVVFDPDNSVDN